MKSPVEHIMTTPWSRLSTDIEAAFFRIEREDRLLGALINGVIAGASVALIAWLITSLREGDLLLFACLGSSAASVVFAPLHKNNSLRTIVLAYCIASATCLVLWPIHTGAWIPLPGQCFLAVALPIAAMRVVEAMHPAAIGSAMAFIIYDRDVKTIFLLLLAILGLLLIVKLLAYIYLEDLRFRDFGKEFRKDYYGREMTVTLRN